MPNVIIREYDLTNPGRADYNNFAVVVPGLVDEHKPAAADNWWDDDDTIKSKGDRTCIINPANYKNAQEWFKNNIGCVGGRALLKPAVVPTFACVADIVLAAENEKPEHAETPLTELVPTNYYEIPASVKKVYKIKATGKTPGKLVDADGKQYELEFDNDGYGAFLGSVLLTYYSLTSATEGEDAFETTTHIGNQIAYELLGLGYTVIFKAIVTTGSETIEGKLKSPAFWECLADRAAYDFRYLVSGLTEENTEVVAQMVKVAQRTNADNAFGRGDAIVLVDIPSAAYLNKTLSVALSGIKAKALEFNTIENATKGKYVAYFAPKFTFTLGDEANATYSTLYNGNRTLPAYMYYLACGKEAELNNTDEWFALAGYNRGRNSFYNIEGISYKFGDAAIAELQNRDTEEYPSVNPIITLRGKQYIWGNRTAYSETKKNDLVASHFLNIRQLCCTLKKQIYMACKELTFEPNSILLWTAFCDRVRPLLEKMQANQGIEDFRLLKLASERKAELKALVRIVPIEAVEDFDISITLEDSIEGTLVTFGDIEAEE